MFQKLFKTRVRTSSGQKAVPWHPLVRHRAVLATFTEDQQSGELVGKNNQYGSREGQRSELGFKSCRLL